MIYKKANKSSVKMKSKEIIKYNIDIAIKTFIDVIKIKY